MFPTKETQTVSTRRPHTVNIPSRYSCALQRKSFVNGQHLALSAARLLTCVCSGGMLSMTVIWPRLQACFGTPSHYKSGRQECGWVSRPVSPLRPSLLCLSRHALPPTSSPSSASVTALHPSTRPSYFSLSHLFSPLPMLFLFPPPSLQPMPFPLPSFPFVCSQSLSNSPPTPHFKFYDLSEIPSHLFSPSRPARSYQWRMLRMTLYAAFNCITCISVEGAAVSVSLCFYVVVMLLCFGPLVSHDSVCHGNTMGEASKQLNQSLTQRDLNRVKVDLLWEHKVCSQAFLQTDRKPRDKTSRHCACAAAYYRLTQGRKTKQQQLNFADKV